MTENRKILRGVLEPLKFKSSTTRYIRVWKCGNIANSHNLKFKIAFDLEKNEKSPWYFYVNLDSNKEYHGDYRMNHKKNGGFTLDLTTNCRVNYT